MFQLFQYENMSKDEKREKMEARKVLQSHSGERRES